VTRTVAEAGATVKGLTGMDIPSIISQAIGGAADGGQQPPPGGGGSSRGGGGGRTRRPSGGRGGSGAAAPRPAPAAPTATPPVTAAPTDTPPQAAPSAPSRGSGGPPPAVNLSTPVGAEAPAQRPQFTSQEEIDTALADADRAMRSATTPTPPPIPRTDTAAGPARPARPASLDINRDTTVDEAARRLASDLRALPGIDRFADVRLRQLDSAGPRALRTMWRLSREGLDEGIADLTIGQLIDRYGSSRRPS